MSRTLRPVARPHTAPRGDCPVCVGTGYEPQLNKRTGKVALVGCFWCEGTGYTGMGADAPAVCPCCEKVVVVLAGEGACPDCTRWEPCDGRYADDFEGEIPD